MTEQHDNLQRLSLRQKLSQPETESPPWSLASALLTLIVLFVCLTMVGPALASIVLGADEITPFLLLLSWALGLALSAFFVLINRRASDASWRALRLARGDLPWTIALLHGVAIALAIDLIVSLAGGRFLPMPEVVALQSAGAASLMLAALLLLLLQPLAETLVFQGVLLPSLRSALGPGRGVLATGALYTLLHALVYSAALPAAYPPLWYGIVYPTLLGLSFCLMRVYTNASGAVLVGRMGAGLIFFLTALALTGA